MSKPKPDYTKFMRGPELMRAQPVETSGEQFDPELMENEGLNPAASDHRQERLPIHAPLPLKRPEVVELPSSAGCPAAPPAEPVIATVRAGRAAQAVPALYLGPEPVPVPVIPLSFIVILIVLAAIAIG